MKQEDDYVLKRLDEWYSDRIRRHYTSEMGETFVRRMEDNLRKAGFLEELVESDRWRDTTNDIRDPEKLAASISPFREGYRFIEELLNGGDIEGFNLRDIPEGLLNEYYTPLINNWRRFQKFVDSVRKESDELFPEPVNDSQIDKCWKKVFKNSREYSQFAISHFRAYLLMLNLHVNRGEMPRESFSYAEALLSNIKDLVFDLNKGVFGDLDERAI